MLQAVAIISVIVCFIIGYFIISIMRRQREVLKWQQTRIKAEIETLEKERKRIASDLHDELGPMLSAIKLQINHLEPTDETEIQALDKSSSQIDDIIQRFRDISYDLLPNTLVRKGLVKAVEEFIGRLKRGNNLAVIFTSPDLNLSQEKAINIYRIIQENIHNTIKHAKANKLTITIEIIGKKLILKTVDDGIGFNYEENMKMANGLGLLNLQSRVEVLDGQLKVISSVGNGTIYNVEIPY